MCVSVTALLRELPLRHLAVAIVLLSYRAAAQRVVLLDWGGTLTPADTGFYDVREEGKYEVPSSVLTTLRQLCADPHNHVMVISGLGRDTADTTLLTGACAAAANGVSSHFLL